MDCVARRTRSRKTLGRGAGLEARPRLHGRGGEAGGSTSAGEGREGDAVSDFPAGLGLDETGGATVGAAGAEVIILEDDEDEDEDEDQGGRGGGGDCEEVAHSKGNRGRRRSRKSFYRDAEEELGARPRSPELWKGEEESGSSSDRKAVIAASDLKSDGSEATVEEGKRSKSGSNEVKSACWSGSDVASGGLDACEAHEGREGERLEVNVVDGRSEAEEACDAAGEREVHKIGDSNGEVEVLYTNCCS